MTGLIDLGDIFTPIINKVLDFIPDPTQKAQAAAQALAAQEAAQAAMEAQDAASAHDQAAVDQVEAGNANLFVSGWRPFIGWCGGVGVLWAYVLTPAIAVGEAVYHGQPIPIPDTANLLQLLFGLLGFGAMRTFEKVNAAGKNLQ